MGKWLDRLKLKTSNGELTMLTKNPSVSFVSEQSQVVPNSTPKLQRLENARQACLEVRTWPYYKTFSAEMLHAEKEAFKRLDSEIEQSVNGSHFLAD